MKYLISISLCMILVAGCSSTEEKPEPKIFSEDTNRAFDMIERGGSYYEKKPITTVPAPQIKTPQKKTHVVETLRPGQQQAVSEEISVEEKINNHEPAISETVHTVKNKNAKVDERLIEINQNLAFYCMKHRKDPAFGGDEARCMKFVNHTMNACQKVHRIVNSKLLSCIQTKLKSRQ
ncbi:MAG: hypothetical protein H7177_00140 [Rhizobacter sp.]|nr:hypothetical protein [Bacteriovorax sp.]